MLLLHLLSSSFLNTTQSTRVTMFRPIKNFINFIQNNPSGSTIFGSTAAVAATEIKPGVDVGIGAKKVVRTQRLNAGSAAKSAEISAAKDIEIKDEEMKRIEPNKLNILNDDRSAVRAANRRDNDDIVVCNADDDIELQIKSSIMLRQPLKRVTLVNDLTDVVDIVGRKEVGAHAAVADYNPNDADSRDEFDDYSHEGTEVVSLLSDDGLGGGDNDTAEELATEEEDAEETCLRMPSQGQRLIGSEIIVINDTDLNSSVASDALSEDPLAIDEFTHSPSIALKDSSNTLDSSTNDEASTSADIMWINIDDIKTNIITPNSPKDLSSEAHKITPTSMPPKELTLSKEKRNSANANSNSATIRVLSGHRDEHVEEIRSDGSDSGLGCETSALQSTIPSLSDTSHLAAPDDSVEVKPTGGKSKITTNTNVNGSSDVSLTDSVSVSTSAVVVPVAVTSAVPPSTVVPRPLRSNLKRRLEDDGALVDLAQHTDVASIDGSQIKKPKRSINFENVQVYYFPRQQGFGCVPSAGGCTLGMGARHIALKTLTLAEHSAELRRAHRLQLQEINPRGSSSDDSEESEEDYLSEGSGSDLDAESNGFLQPVSPKQRRALLKGSGVRKIDAGEKIECRDIRNSREVCGCACIEFCDPETCACSQAGIKCQVDRAMFPCGCTRDACGNTVGRVEFNPTRVRTHFIHTIMRLEMENRQQQNPPLCSTVSSYSLSAACAATATTASTHANAIPPTPSYANVLPGNYYNMQPQSNYSSGYASPAYPSEPAANYYQQQGSVTHYSSAIATEMQTATQHNYQLDTLDGGLFTGTAAATSAYSEMLPAYSSGVGVSATATVSAYHNNLNYSTVQQTQVSTYTSYQQTTPSGYICQHQQSPTVATPTQTTPPATTYSSCAVPSLPPYGAATTTAAAPQYQHSSSYALVDTTAPSCLSIDDSGGSDIGSDAEGGATGDNCSTNSSNKTITTTSCSSNSNVVNSDSSFINLSTSIASATRLSQINDLLQHNRRTTATLVAVSHTAGTGLSVNGGTAVTTNCDYVNISSREGNERVETVNDTMPRKPIYGECKEWPNETTEAIVTKTEAEPPPVQKVDNETAQAAATLQKETAAPSTDATLSSVDMLAIESGVDIATSATALVVTNAVNVVTIN